MKSLRCGQFLEVHNKVLRRVEELDIFSYELSRIQVRRFLMIRPFVRQ